MENNDNGPANSGQNDSGPRDTREAIAALAAVDAGRSAAADRLVSPWWYHPVLGLLLAGYVLVITLGNLVVMLLVIPVYLAGIVALVSTYKRITGVWISGFRAGRASWWAVAMAVIVILISGAAYVLHSDGLVWPAWVAAGSAFVAVNVFGALFDRTLRASLRDGSATLAQ